MVELLVLLPEESAVLYMDSDVIFLRPPEELWQIFSEFDEQQFAAAAESRNELKTSEELKILIVVCVSDSKALLDSSDRQLQQAKVSMKAAVFLSRRRIRFLVVSNSQAIFDELVAATEAWPTAYREKTSFQDMRGLFRPCASQRLFLLRLLPEESAVLYMDSDVIFLRPPEELWQIFNEFDEKQFAAAAVYVAGYHYLPKDVRYSDDGFNSGLMLYNLTRMRQFPAGWEDQVINITAEYRSIFKLGDQDILNIFFGKFRSHFYPLGCEWNLRSFYCQSNFIRHCPEMLKAGAKAVHGTAASFHLPGKFKAS
ncbi:glucoside xylosyltransferase 2-like [Hyalella azteca]|uniref:UDP-D-xylose:beta-D-glucoside alpha-1,3-D-xylosyltransferase n=1 Tax=Hyalella azteca TaxID=294128 RepID=A0A979FNX9_HYAAZ|nr:glucoside xylosyltransferase 2-like [Hyalella azteca]